MSGYALRERKLVPLVVEYASVPQEQVDHIYKELLSASEDDPSELFHDLKGLDDFDLLDLLKEEMVKTPDSPFMRELRRLMKVRLRRQAARIANSIVRSE